MSSEREDLAREALRIVVGPVLVNASNFPPALQARMLGQNMGPLIGRTVEAVVAAGWRPPTERTDAEKHADELLLWIDYCLSLPMYQNVISDYGQGVVEAYRAARKILTKGLHPDAARLAADRKGAES